MSGTITDSNTSAHFQGFPPTVSPMVDSAGRITYIWYRLLQTLWMQVSSGVPNNVTLYDTSTKADHANNSIAGLRDALNDEINRALAAEATLQAQINTFNGQIVSINGQLTTINATLTDLQHQIDVINGRLATAGIP